jgi:hypothetical protein
MKSKLQSGAVGVFFLEPSGPLLERGYCPGVDFVGFIICRQIPVGELAPSWSVPFRQASQSQFPRMRLSFEQKGLWEKIDLPCDWLVNLNDVHPCGWQETLLPQ